MQEGNGVSSNGRVITLEEFIIDTFTHIQEDGSQVDVDQPDQIGGGGSYAIIGARIFLPPTKVGMLLSYTPESLPEPMRQSLLAYGEEMWAFVLRKDGNPTTRILNTYHGQIRTERYLSPPNLFTPLSLLSTPWINPSNPEDWPIIIHFISYSDRARKVVEELDILREKMGKDDWIPKLVWEPYPPMCIPENVTALRELVPFFDIISPNHTEALSFFPSLSIHPNLDKPSFVPFPLQETPQSTSNLPSPPPDSLPHDLEINETDVAEERLKENIELACLKLLSFKPKIGVIIRCGHLGCCYALSPFHSDSLFKKPSNSQGPLFENTPDSQMMEEIVGKGENEERTKVIWIPAYWDKSDEEKKVDPTGAGNAFMGGVCAALHKGLDLHQGTFHIHLASGQDRVE
ncbi:hypothetical protein M231_05103 [Tremella mesenterica]|uniref:Carbohydrate kinase PfkB domain-containing protein n=1 Tax=Tremella mesenterica TaxID=5217 RepID=A0A4V1M3P9_TREME|nr:hypothetical protein M231_05103 [Tremella mesenterica]